MRKEKAKKKLEHERKTGLLFSPWANQAATWTAYPARNYFGSSSVSKGDGLPTCNENHNSSLCSTSSHPASIEKSRHHRTAPCPLYGSDFLPRRISVILCWKRFGDTHKTIPGVTKAIFTRSSSGKGNARVVASFNSQRQNIASFGESCVAHSASSSAGSIRLEGLKPVPLDETKDHHALLQAENYFRTVHSKRSHATAPRTHDW